MEIQFAVALPMYNEQECAEYSVRSLFTALKDIDDTAKVITIDDGSTDKTPKILDSLALEFDNLIVVHHAENKGYGGAIKTAYMTGIAKQLDYLLFMDADLTQDPVYLSLFIPFMKNGVDLIKGSRYIRGGGVKNVPWSRVIVSRIGNLIALFLFRIPLRDYTNGFRAVSMRLAKNFDLKATKFDLLLEEVAQAKRLKATFAEVPYILTARESDQGKSSFSYRPSVFYRYLRHCFKVDF